VSWAEKVRIKQQTPPLRLEEGTYILEVVEEPEAPVTTRFGERLVYKVRKDGDSDIRSLFIPYREEASENTALGQLKALTEKYGTLKGKKLKVVVAGKGRSKRYSFSVVEQVKLETCPNCGTAVTSDAKFCNQCGAKLRG
jgi:ribosomal protein L32